MIRKKCSKCNFIKPYTLQYIYEDITIPPNIFLQKDYCNKCKILLEKKKSKKKEKIIEYALKYGIQFID